MRLAPDANALQPALRELWIDRLDLLRRLFRRNKVFYPSGGPAGNVLQVRLGQFVSSELEPLFCGELDELALELQVFGRFLQESV